MTPRSRNSSVSSILVEDFGLGVHYDETRSSITAPTASYECVQDQTNDHEGELSFSRSRSCSQTGSERSNTSSSSCNSNRSTTGTSSLYLENRSFLGQVFQTLFHFFFLPTQIGVDNINITSNNQEKHVQESSSEEVTENDVGEGQGQEIPPPPSPTGKEIEEAYWGQHGASLGVEIDGETTETASTVRAIALRLEGALRAAKKAHLQTSEVLLPPDLLSKVARDILLLAETEPCGIRGCLVILSFESGHQSPPPSPPVSTNPTNNNSLTNNNNNPAATAPTTTAPASAELTSGNSRKIGTVKCDQQTVTTFELHLSLREDLAPWYSRLPQILRNLAKGGTIVVSPAYTIAKKKLYRSH